MFDFFPSLFNPLLDPVRPFPRSDQFDLRVFGSLPRLNCFVVVRKNRLGSWVLSTQGMLDILVNLKESPGGHFGGWLAIVTMLRNMRSRRRRHSSFTLTDAFSFTAAS